MEIMEEIDSMEDEVLTTLHREDHLDWVMEVLETDVAMEVALGVVLEGVLELVWEVDLEVAVEDSDNDEKNSKHEDVNIFFNHFSSLFIKLVIFIASCHSGSFTPFEVAVNQFSGDIIK